jgi:hypothetical protein
MTPPKPRPTPPAPRATTSPGSGRNTPRPDELSRETFEFIAAIDEYKRKHMRSFLSDREVLGVLRALGYGQKSAAPEPSEAELPPTPRRARATAPSTGACSRPGARSSSSWWTSATSARNRADAA